MIYRNKRRLIGSNKIAKIWDREATNYHIKTDEQVDYLANFYHLEKCVGDVKDKKILEVGSGTGQGSAFLASKGAETHLVDISEKSLQFAKKYFSYKKLPVKTYKQNIFSMNFRTGSFDVVWNGGVIEHFNDRQKIKLLKKMWKLVKHDGKLLVTVPNAHDFPFMMAKKILEIRRKWVFGIEDDLTITRLRKLALQSNIKNFFIYAYNPIVGIWFFPYGREITNILGINRSSIHQLKTIFGHNIVLCAHKLKSKMKILVLTRRKWPKIGGVEKHIDKVYKVLERKGFELDFISEDEIKYPQIKYFGLFSIWYWLFKNRHLIKNADIIHCHDVFIWYLPFRLLYPSKKLITTIHGLEWDNPLHMFSIFQKHMAILLSNYVVGIGNFLEKNVDSKFALISYGAAKVRVSKTIKDKNRIVYVGRLEENTGLSNFLKWLDKNQNYKVDFCGDGNLQEVCKKYGKVHGFCNPNPFYKKAKIVVPGGYLAALEALNSGCEIKLFWNNKVKEDYWKMSPFYKFKGNKLKKWAKEQTWEKLANEYINLYNSTK